MTRLTRCMQCCATRNLTTCNHVAIWRELRASPWAGYETTTICAPPQSPHARCIAWRLGDRDRNRYAVLLRPHRERGHDGRIQRHAVSGLLAITLQSTFAGKAHAIDAGPRFAVVSRVGKSVHLPLECSESAERFRIEHLHENRCAPSRRRVGSTVAG